MSLNFVTNQDALKKIMDAAKHALKQTAYEVKEDLVKSGTMPFDSGHLQNEATYVDETRVKDGVAAIVSDTVYARRKFFHPEFNFDRSVNRAASGRWFDEYVVGGKRGFVREVFDRIIRN